MNKKVIMTVTSVLLLMGCSEGGSWNFRADYLSIDINHAGYITSMKNITMPACREFSPVDKPSPLLSLYNSKNKAYYYTPQKARYNRISKVITLDYPNGSVARVSLRPQDKYIRLTLKSLELRNGVDVIQWGSYYTNINNLFGEIIGVARDTSDAVNYSIGVLALNDNTIGGTADLDGDAAPFQYIIHTNSKITR